jgi:hypothetical protein
MFVPWKVGYTEAELRAAVAQSTSLTDTLRRLGLRPAGGNHQTLRKYIELAGISTDHFDPYAACRGPRPDRVRLSEVLVEGSSYRRATLKQRLYEEGLKPRRCEMCGQGELWHGRQMSLILDHINGVADDNRLGNLRIVCPNCAATLETHCGRQLRRSWPERICPTCGDPFAPKSDKQTYCCRPCAWHRSALRLPHPERRKVIRPPYDELLRQLAQSSYLAVGRRYGVSDNAIRKWVRQYGRERLAVASSA